MQFTFEQVCQTARIILNAQGIDKLCIDEKDTAMLQPSLDEAAEILVHDTLYWEFGGSPQ